MILSSACQPQADPFPALSGRHGDCRSYTTPWDTIQERARDTRRRVVLGSLILHQLEFNADGEPGALLREWLRRDLPSFLTRYGDNELFADILPQPDPSTHKEEER